MIDLVSTAATILREAGYRTLHDRGTQHLSLSFEDNAVLGFISTYETPAALLANWRIAEKAALSRFAPNLSRAPDKAWNIYSVFLCPEETDEDTARAIRQIEEDLDLTRKIAACRLASRDDLIVALLPLLPLQYTPQLKEEDVLVRLRRRMNFISPAAADVVLDEAISPLEAVRRLGGAQ